MRRRRLREPFVYFVDECLGRHVVPDALRRAVEVGERVEVLPQGTLDVDWIPVAHRGGWVCLTKDRALRRRPNELAALLAAEFAVFVVGEARGEAQAARIVHALPTMRRALRARDVPLIGRVEDDGGVTILYDGGKQLSPPRRMKPTRGQTPIELERRAPMQRVDAQQHARYECRDAMHRSGRGTWCRALQRAVPRSRSRGVQSRMESATRLIRRRPCNRSSVA